MPLLEYLSVRTLRLALVAVTIIAFAMILRNGFVSLDDDYLIYRNPAVQSMTPANVGHVFTSYDPQLYIPLTFVSYQLTAVLFGMQPVWFHLGNLLLHMGSALLVFSIVTKLSGKRSIGFFTALLFAIHPLQTEAVAWAAARKDVLSGFFFLLSMHFYLRFREREDVSRLWISVAVFALGLFSKVSIIVLPFILLLIDWLQRRRFSREVFVEKIPYLILCILFGIIAVIGKSRVLASSSALFSALLPLKSIAFYLVKLALPFGLSVIYPQEPTLASTLPWIAAGGIVLLATVSIAIVSRMTGRARLFAFGLLWHLVLLVPSFSTYWKNGFFYFASDRYAYLACVGIFLVVASLLDRLDLWSQTRKFAMEFGTILGALFAIALIPLTIAQSRVWHDSAALYSNVIRNYPESAMAHNNLGMELDRSGKSEEAMAQFRRANALAPGNSLALFNIAAVEGKSGNIPEAVATYERIIAILGPQELTMANELKRFFWLAAKFETLGKPEDALALLPKIVSLAPQFPDAHGELGLLLDRLGKHDEAIPEFRKAAALGSRDPRVYAQIGIAASAEGNFPEAKRMFQHVLALDPGNSDAEEYLKEIERRGG
ncbi:tetratricopeptide repeat protein [Candidatus Peregrinibacteria bacterium]|nr:tetratricopeptide repeat protein [Candidatus Peregrinibacteria bacterium]MBI3816605.1 tetratricopeptide repeat protein [Candidatus Peregrinibacteria bacterium]